MQKREIMRKKELKDTHWRHLQTLTSTCKHFQAPVITCNFIHIVAALPETLVHCFRNFQRTQAFIQLTDLVKFVSDLRFQRQ